MSDERARDLARTAAGLAVGAGIALPASLQLWALAGGRPAGVALPSVDPAGDLGAALEAQLSEGERRQGAHYTPVDVADRIAELLLAVGNGPTTVVDPAAGGGALLLAAARRLVRLGASTALVARDLLWAADIEPLAAAVTEAAITLWSGGTAPAPGHVVVADTLIAGRGAWPDPPGRGFGAVVGNPPFQGQLGRGTVRSAARTAALRALFGAAAPAYVDTAALFLLVAIDLVGPGGRVAMVLPQSVVAARDAAGVREVVSARAALRELWAPPGSAFGARVHVCVPVLEVGARDEGGPWAGRLAEARGVPAIELVSGPTVAHLAAAVASFRQEYYALAGAVREGAGGANVAPLVTSGRIDVGCVDWDRPVRFAKQRWARPEVDLELARGTSPRVARWLDRVRRPKVVVASQTRVVEAAADRDGTWVPATPVLALVPHEPTDVDRLAAAVCAPPVAAWVAQRAAGTALSADAVRTSASLLLEIPLPPDAARWARATALLAEGDVGGFGRAATEMHRLPPSQADAVLAWWTRHRPR